MSDLTNQRFVVSLNIFSLLLSRINSLQKHTQLIESIILSLLRKHIIVNTFFFLEKVHEYVSPHIKVGAFHLDKSVKLPPFNQTLTQILVVSAHPHHSELFLLLYDVTFKSSLEYLVLVL